MHTPHVIGFALECHFPADAEQCALVLCEDGGWRHPKLVGMERRHAAKLYKTQVTAARRAKQIMREGRIKDVRVSPQWTFKETR